MATFPNSYRGFRFPAEVIQHAVWPYHCFSLSLRGAMWPRFQRSCDAKQREAPNGHHSSS